MELWKILLIAGPSLIIGLLLGAAMMRSETEARMDQISREINELLRGR